jgi:hypothetical protein
MQASSAASGRCCAPIDDRCISGLALKPTCGRSPAQALRLNRLQSRQSKTTRSRSRSAVRPRATVNVKVAPTGLHAPVAEVRQTHRDRSGVVCTAVRRRQVRDRGLSGTCRRGPKLGGGKRRAILGHRPVGEAHRRIGHWSRAVARVAGRAHWPAAALPPKKEPHRGRPTPGAGENTCNLERRRVGGSIGSQAAPATRNGDQ